MADRLVLHIGLMKSGTTFLQGFLSGSKQRLLQQEGVLFPGAAWRDQVHAVVDFMGYDARRTPQTEGGWARLKDEVDRHPGTAVVSMEFLAAVRPVNIDRFIAEFPGTRTEVVVTVRDLGRNLPAMWQESLKNGYTWSWHEYLEGVRGGPAGRHFWRQQAAAKIVGKWAAAVGTGSTTVITLPPKGAPRDVLWRRFCEATGMAAAADWDLPSSANESLGVASSQLLRRLNTLLQGMPVPAYQAVVKNVLGNRVLAARKSTEDPIGFTAQRWVTERANIMAERLVESGVPIVGSLAELAPVDVPGVDPDEVTAEEILEAGLVALEALVRRQAPDVAPGRKGQRSL